MTLEGIDMVLKLWQAEAPFDFKGQFWRIRIENPNPDVALGPMLKPYQKPHPPIAMSVVKGTSMGARTAGERGYMPVSTNVVPAATVAQHWQTYYAGAEGAGRPAPDRSIWGVSRSIFVGESKGDAWDFAVNSTFGRSWNYMIKIVKAANLLDIMKLHPDMSDDEVTLEYVLENLCIIGDVEECVRQLEDLWEVTGGFGTLLMIAHDWDDKARWLRSMKFLANEVVPALPSV